MLYTAAVSSAEQALRQAGHLLDKVEATDGPLPLLSARLAPLMLDCAAQLRTTAGFALRATFPLTARAVPFADFPYDLPGLRAYLAFAEAQIETLEPADFAGAERREITHRAGEAALTQDGASYLHLFALPNLWFHLGMAYAILRAQGLPVGKADFDGWHVYPAESR